MKKETMAQVFSCEDGPKDLKYPKKCLIHGSKMFLLQGSKKCLYQRYKKFLLQESKRFLLQGSKKYLTKLVEQTDGGIQPTSN